MTSNPLTDKQIVLAVELAKARVEYVRKHGAPLLNNEEEVTLIALRELQDKRKLLKAAERRMAELEEIATDYALKFQKAQDALKHAALLYNAKTEKD